MARGGPNLVPSAFLSVSSNYSFCNFYFLLFEGKTESRQMTTCFDDHDLQTETTSENKVFLKLFCFLDFSLFSFIIFDFLKTSLHLFMFLAEHT